MHASHVDKLETLRVLMRKGITHIHHDTLLLGAERGPSSSLHCQTIIRVDYLSRISIRLFRCKRGKAVGITDASFTHW